MGTVIGVVAGAIGLFSLLASPLNAVSDKENSLESRQTTMETEVSDYKKSTDDRLDRIETKIDTLTTHLLK